MARSLRWLAGSLGHRFVPTLAVALYVGGVGLGCVAAEAERPSIIDQPSVGSPAPAGPKIKTVAVSPAPPGKDDPQVRSTHGAWQVRCQPAAQGKSEQCAVMQSVVATKPPGLGLTAIILKTADKKGLLMRILAPSGVLLPSGMGLTIDGNDLGRTGFVRCIPTGCVAEVLLDPDVFDKLKTGKTATFIIFQTPEEGLAIPIPLAGLGQGVEALP